ncbi:MAG: ABC transporter ATP-binding protein [Thermomicrobiales bacterium]|nr:ABC transporter ATP-binding protein [Thermomicrobiales bacterium]
MVATARLAADSVTLGYDEQTIVSDVSLAIPDGKITTIIGPNGCGKSTLLRSLVRLKAPDSGTVILDGQAIQHFPTKEVAKRLGLLAQQATAPGGVTVEDLVMRGRFPHQSFLQPPNQQDRDAVDRALDLTNMTGLRTRPVDQLSGGQRQRAWIAMVLAQETPILLLDEPTTYLDIAHQLQIVELVRHLNETDGRTIVLVLHDINEAIRISHNIVAMKDGQILAQGSPASIITSELIGEIYGAECDVLLAPGQDKPFCIPRGRHAASPESREAAAAVFEVDGLRTSYGKINVLHGLTCDMPAGAITGIVGPNACGKSTLLRSCGRLLRPTEGQVRLAGRDVNRGKHKELSRNLSLMAQSPTMPSGFQVEDLVSLGRAPHQGFFRQWREEDEEAVETALNHCNLCELRRRSIETLSGGQRQRAWFGMTLAQDTPVLLLDEPTTFLDLAAQIEMLDLVREMNQAQQRSVVMVLHDLNLAARYCDYLIVMKDGQIVTSGTPRAVVTEEMLADVFGIEATVMPDPANGMPLVIPHQAIEEMHASAHDSNNG